jgi:hypothetical protein
MFGYPFDWLAQDQTTLNAPFPATLSPASPWENPTTVAFGPLLLDALVVYLVLLGGWSVAGLTRRSIGSAAN